MSGLNRIFSVGGATVLAMSLAAPTSEAALFSYAFTGELTVVENPNGDIYDPKYENTLKKIHDEVFLTPGVDRAWVKSLWAPGVRWTEVTEEGFRGGPVMPDNYNGSATATEALRANIARAGIVGSLVGNDFKSSMLVVPLLDIDPKTGQRIDVSALAHSLEQLRSRVEADGHTRVHVIGFAKLVGDLIDGLIQVSLYFALAGVMGLGDVAADHVPHRRRIATRVEALPRVLADGLEQPVAHPAVRVVDDDEGLVHQLTQHVDHIQRVELVTRQDCLRGSKITAACEHRQPVQRNTLCRGEQVIGPVDRAPQRLVTLQCRATAVGEELEPLIEAGDEILR
jgi:hypothetical protein